MAALTEDQAAYVAGLVEVAGWLSNNPDAIPAGDVKVLRSFYTVAAVERFAGRHGLDVVVDDVTRVVSATMWFGPRVAFGAFCLIDKDAEGSALLRRHRAEEYAAEHGLVLVPADQAAGVSA